MEQLADDVYGTCNLKSPFENIALAFSGGGFRASAYALGVLSYLDRIEMDPENKPGPRTTLLGNVRFISSASGGTITSALFAKSVAEGKAFHVLYKDLIELMSCDDLLERALGHLKDDSCWKSRPNKARNLINAFAIAYDDECMFQGITLGKLTNPLNSHYKLEEVSFVATEFFTGIPFRQQKKLVNDPADTHGKSSFYGNYNVRVNNDFAEKIKLADILAASSCFPAGFEPIVFPDDFTYDQLTPDYYKEGWQMIAPTNSDSEKEFISRGKVGLMDGGITDNQGLEGVMESDLRRRSSLHEGEDGGRFMPFDLMLVNDVSSYFMSPYEVREPDHSFGFTLNGLTFFQILILLSGCLATYYGNKTGSLVTVISGTILVVFSVMLLGILIYFNRVIRSPGNRSVLSLKHDFSGIVVSGLTSSFRKAPVRTVINMLKARGSSVFILVAEVYMKRVRQIIYERFFIHRVIFKF